MNRMIFAAALALLLVCAPVSGQPQCGDGSPAYSVPETRSGARLWPPSGLRPGDDDLIPDARDSTDYLSVSIPGADSKHELFQSVDAAAGYLFAAYNAGLSVWDVSTPGSFPRMAVADGWRGDFEEFPLPGEASILIEDVAAAADGAGGIYVALSGLDPVGTSLWRFEPASGLTQVGQHASPQTRQVRLAELDGELYVFAAGSQGVSAFEASTLFPARGSVGGETQTRRYLDVLAQADGSVLVAASSGGSVPMRLWRVSDEGLIASAAVLYDGASLGSGVKGVALFASEGAAHLALVQSHRLKIFDVGHCLASGCSSLGAAKLDLELPGPWPSTEFLTFSRSAAGTPYLYYGFEAAGAAGSKREMLLDLSGIADGNVYELTDGGESYVDACANVVDYWGDYYDGNEHGLRGFSPRVGVFDPGGERFYRAATTVLDFHHLDGSAAVPVVTTSAAGGSRHFMGDVVSLSAVSQGCSGAGSWNWFADEAAVIIANGSSAELIYPLCSESGCPTRSLEVWAVHDACAADPELVIGSASLTIEDPRPQVAGILQQPLGDPPGVIERCALVDFEALVSGRPPLTTTYSITSRSTGEQAAAGSGAEWSWDTSELDGLSMTIVSAGLETGDLSEFDAPPPAGEVFYVRADASNASGSAGRTHRLTVRHPDALAWDGGEPLTATNFGAGVWEIRAEAQGASECRFEAEDDFGQMVDHGWSRECRMSAEWNAAGVRTIRAFARNCTGPTEISAEIEVSVEGTQAPEVVAVVPSTPGCSPDPLTAQWSCPAGELTFLVAALGEIIEFGVDWDGDGAVDETFPADIPPTIVGELQAGVRTFAVRARSSSQTSAWFEFTVTVF